MSIADAEALIAAAERGDIGDVRRMLMSGVDVNARGVDGRTAILAALGEGHVEIALLRNRPGKDVPISRLRS